MQDVAISHHLHTKELTLEVDAYSLLRSTVESLQPSPLDPRLFTIIEDVVVVGIDVQLIDFKGDIAGLDVFFHRARVREG